MSGSDPESPRHIRVCQREERKPVKIKALIIYVPEGGGGRSSATPSFSADVHEALGMQVGEENDLKSTSSETLRHRNGGSAPTWSKATAFLSEFLSKPRFPAAPAEPWQNRSVELVGCCWNLITSRRKIGLDGQKRGPGTHGANGG